MSETEDNKSMESTAGTTENNETNANAETQVQGTNGNTHGTNGDANGTGEVDEEFQRRYQKMQAYMRVTDLILKERLPKMFSDCKYVSYITHLFLIIKLEYHDHLFIANKQIVPS